MNILKEKEEKTKIFVCKITILAVTIYFLGIGTNLLVKSVNDWKMPVLGQIKIPDNDKRHCNATISTKLIILCDWVPVSKDSLLTWPMRKINKIDTNDDILASPGDIFIWASVWILILLSPATIILLFLKKIFKSH